MQQRFDRGNRAGALDTAFVIPWTGGGFMWVPGLFSHYTSMSPMALAGFSRVCFVSRI